MTPVLLDTSVWRRHFAGRLTAEHGRWLHTLLDEDGVVFTHPWVVGELVLGGLAAREEELLGLLPSLNVVDHTDVLGFVRRRRLSQRGIGWIDVHLLASALTGSAALWSLDKNLEAVAQELGVQFHGLQ